MTEKKELRKHCIEKMNALPQDYCREADGKIFSAVLGLPEYRNAKKIFCFVGMQAEIQTASLIEEMLRAGKQVAVPRCAGRGVMHALVIRSLAELRPGTMGILEPSAEAPVLAPEELDLILLPCEPIGRTPRLRRRVLRPLFTKDQGFSRAFNPRAPALRRHPARSTRSAGGRCYHRSRNFPENSERERGRVLNGAEIGLRFAKILLAAA